ncbi:MAG: T9SS type A sorting domain-containing protein, partial [Prolixibacteraceae bacterium]|nr:T9SS type A sorting domain-containing protein [Prolixibacteraceae bacterium]
MKRIITFLLFIAMVMNMFGQANDAANLEKYWYYRQRLKDNFLFLSNTNEAGSNIPVDRIVPNVQYVNGNVEVAEIQEIEWDDCNGALPYYIMLLATEYKLLKKYAYAIPANTTAAAQTLSELNNAIKALKRLDLEVDGVINGVYRRTDIKYLERNDLNRSSSVLGEHFDLVDYFDNISGTEQLIKYDFAEKFTNNQDLEDKYLPEVWPTKLSLNEGYDKYNSFDNITKFIEAEAIVYELLDGEGYEAFQLRNALHNLVKPMIENMYHPNEPRKLFDRNAIGDWSGFMRRTWYLEDPDLTPSFLPKNLIPIDCGGGADPYTYLTSYGFAKSAKRFNLDYDGTDFSAYFFKRAMNADLKFVELQYYEVSYACDNQKDTIVYVVGEDGSRLSPNPSYRFFCGSRTEKYLHKEEIIDFLKPPSMWMLRSLVATNDISGSYIGLPLHQNQRPYYFLKNAGNNYSKELEQYPLIWSILNTKKFISNYDRYNIGSLLNIAPACGPYNIMYEDDYGTRKFEYKVYEWSCPNRFIWPELNGIEGTTDTGWKRSGYFNGIDYMVLHNLYWLTKIDQDEFTTSYDDYEVLDDYTNVSSESASVIARYSVTMSSGFKVTISGDYKYLVTTNPDMRTGYDQDVPFEVINVENYETTCECDPIYKEEDVFETIEKSAFVTPTSSEKSIDELILDVFPNPSEGNLTVTCNENLDNIMVLDATGNIKLEFGNLDAEKHTFTIEHLADGLYIIKARTYNGYEKV